MGNGRNLGRPAAALLLVFVGLALSAALANGANVEYVWGGPNTGGAGTPCATTAAGAVDYCTPTNAFVPGIDQATGPTTQRAAGAFELQFTTPIGGFPAYDENISLQSGTSTAAGSYDPVSNQFEAGWQCNTDENKGGIGPLWAITTVSNLAGAPCYAYAKTAYGCTPPPTGCGCTSGTPTTQNYPTERLVCPAPSACAACGPTPPCVMGGGNYGCHAKWTVDMPCRFAAHPLRTDMRWYNQANFGTCGAQTYIQDVVDDWASNALYYGFLNQHPTYSNSGPNCTSSLVDADINGEGAYCVPKTAGFIPDTNYNIDFNFGVGYGRTIDNNFGLAYSPGAIGKWDLGYGDHNVNVGVRKGRPMSYVPDDTAIPFKSYKCRATPQTVWVPATVLTDFNYNYWEIMDFNDQYTTGTAGQWFQNAVGAPLNSASCVNPAFTSTDTNFFQCSSAISDLTTNQTFYAYNGTIVVKPCRWVNQPQTTDIQIYDVNLSADAGTSGGVWRTYPVDWIDDWNAAVMYESVNVDGYGGTGTCPTDMVGRMGDGNNLWCFPGINFTVSKYNTDSNFVITVKIMPNISASGPFSFQISPFYQTGSQNPANYPSMPSNGALFSAYSNNTGLAFANDCTTGGKPFALVDVNQTGGLTGCTRQVDSTFNTARVNCAVASGVTGGTTYTFSLVTAACPTNLTGGGSPFGGSYYTDIDINVVVLAATPPLVGAWPFDGISSWGCNPACTSNAQCKEGDTCKTQGSPTPFRCDSYCGGDTIFPDVNILWPEGGSHYQKTDGNVSVKFTVRDQTGAFTTGGDEVKASLYASLYPGDFNATGLIVKDLNLAQVARYPTVDANCSAPISYATNSNAFFDQNVVCFYDWDPSGLADQNYFIDANVYDKAKNTSQDSTPKEITNEPGLVSGWNFNPDNVTGQYPGQWYQYGSQISPGYDRDVNTTHDFNFGGTCTSYCTLYATSPVEGYDANFTNIYRGDVQDYTASNPPTYFDTRGAQTWSYWLKPWTYDLDANIFALWGTSAFDLSLQHVWKFTYDRTTNTELRGYIASSLSDTENNYITTTNANILTGSWQFITHVFDGSQAAANRLKTYVNGNPVGYTVTGTIPTSMTTTQVGAAVRPLFGNPGRNFAGGDLNAAVDSVSVWDNPLSKKTIRKQAGAVWIKANTAPVVASVKPTGSGDTCSPSSPYTVTWTANDAQLDDLNFSLYYGTDGGTCANNNNLIFTNNPDTNLSCDASGSTCTYTWGCNVSPGDNYYLRVVAGDGFTTGSACSSNTVQRADAIAPDVNILAPEGGSHYQSTDGNISVKFTVRDTTGNGDYLRMSAYASLFASDFNVTGKFGTDVNLAAMARNPAKDYNCTAGTSYTTSSSGYFDQNVVCYYGWNPSGLADQNYFIDLNVYDKLKNVGQDSTPQQPSGTEAGLVSAWNFNKDDSNVLQAADANTTGARNGTLVFGPRWDQNVDVDVNGGYASPVEGADINISGSSSDYVSLGISNYLNRYSNGSAFLWAKVAGNLASTAFLSRGQAAVLGGGWGNGAMGIGNINISGYPALGGYFLVNGVCCSWNGSKVGYADSKWHFLGWTSNADANFTFYFDGRPTVYYSPNYVFRFNTAANDMPTILGKDTYDTNNYPAHGLIDSVSLWNGALTRKQVKQMSGSVLISANDAPTVQFISPTASGQSCTDPGPYNITWTTDDADLDDVNFSLYYGTDASTCTNNNNLIIGNISQTTAGCLAPEDTNCLYAWTCSVTSGNYYLRVDAADKYTTTTACSSNTLNVIPEYDEITMALAALMAAGIFLRVRRKAENDGP